MYLGQLWVFDQRLFSAHKLLKYVKYIWLMHILIFCHFNMHAVTELPASILITCNWSKEWSFYIQPYMRAQGATALHMDYNDLGSALQLMVIYWHDLSKISAYTSKQSK